MNYKFLLSFLNLILFYINAPAQPAPAPVQKEIICIQGGTIHVGNGTMIPNGIIIFEKNKIIYVGIDSNQCKGVKTKINASGKHIYPGFICPATNLGLAEIEQVKATLDDREIGSLNANVRSLTAYNTDSKIIPTVRSNGMLLAQIIPQGGIISGQSSILQLDAWNWEDAVIKADDGVFLNWPGLSFRNYTSDTEKQQTQDRYQLELNSIKNYFDEAFAYANQSQHFEKNLGFEALRLLWTSKKKLYIRAHQAKAIIQAVQFAKNYGITPILVGASDSWRITDFLKQNQIPIILTDLHSLPLREDDDIDQPYKNPKILQDQGILFCLSMNGFWQQRNLVFQAGHALGYGLEYEQAVASISLNAAKIMGIEEQTGSIEIGKDATLFISEGDALDIRSNHVTRAFIQGRDIDLDNKQKELYRRFWSKYHPN
ncbi:MAG: amidohydrolase family protein [Saprospiraceae bacterium]